MVKQVAISLRKPEMKDTKTFGWLRKRCIPQSRAIDLPFGSEDVRDAWQPEVQAYSDFNQFYKSQVYDEFDT